MHQLRVALRRLRSLFSICKSLFEDSRFDQLREELRWLAGETGQVRNIDVMIARVTNEDLSERLQRARDGAYATLQISLSSARTRSLVIDVAEFISDERRSGGSQEALCGQPSRDFATTVLDKLWKKVAKSGSNLVDADDGTRHRLRIAAKKLRYAAEFFEPLFKSKAEAKRHRRFITAVAGLQDQLGVLNDLATALDRLSALELLDVAGRKISSAQATRRGFCTMLQRRMIGLSIPNVSGVESNASSRKSGLFREALVFFQHVQVHVIAHVPFRGLCRG